MNDEERAALYREQVAAQRNSRAQQFIALHGNRQRREELDAAWAPPPLAALEGRGGMFMDDLEDTYAEVPEQDIYVSEVPGDLLL
jgi:hypothetical protein